MSREHRPQAERVARIGFKPTKMHLAGETYVPSVLLVTGRDEQGRPRECRIVQQEQQVHLQGGEEFLVVFAHEASIAKRS